MPGLSLKVAQQPSTLRGPNVVAVASLVFCILAGAAGAALVRDPIPVIVGLLAGLVAMQSPKVAQQWERAVVLRLGRFVGLHGPGLFSIVPLIDKVDTWIDQRTITTSFAAEQTLFITGEALLGRSTALAAYGAFVFACFFLFVLLYEEPVLKAKFGATYDAYCAAVPRWIPGPTAFGVGKSDNRTLR